MKQTIEQAVGQMILAAFKGAVLPSDLLTLFQQQHLGGVSLFRVMNIFDATQARAAAKMDESTEKRSYTRSTRQIYRQIQGWGFAPPLYLPSSWRWNRLFSGESWIITGYD